MPEIKTDQSTVLPLTIITPVDLGRLRRELTELEDYNLQSSLRQPGQQPQLPRVSRGLEELADQNNLNLLQDTDRQQLQKITEVLHRQAPVLHLSFAAGPSASFLTKLITWLRQEIHPQVLINVGLQPGLAAGCILRSPNKYFDFSLRRYLNQNSKLLLEALKEKD